MIKTLLTSALILGSAVASQAATIAVIDGGGPTAGDLAHTTITDLSTGGDSIGGITGGFTSDASGWRTADTSYWNNTEWDFAPGAGSTATWTFSNMAEGTQWDVYSTWKLQDNRSYDAPYTIQGGADILIDQEIGPNPDLILNDSTDGVNEYNFEKIGTATVNGAGEIVITLSSVADTGDGSGDWVIVDAIAIQAVVPEPSSAALLGLGGLALILRRRK